MKTYQTWSACSPMEYIDAATSFEARKAFAAKHRLPVFECMARSCAPRCKCSAEQLYLVGCDCGARS